MVAWSGRLKTGCLSAKCRMENQWSLTGVKQSVIESLAAFVERYAGMGGREQSSQWSARRSIRCPTWSSKSA